MAKMRSPLLACSRARIKRRATFCKWRPAKAHTLLRSSRCRTKVREAGLRSACVPSPSGNHRARVTGISRSGHGMPALLHLSRHTPQPHCASPRAYQRAARSGARAHAQAMRDAEDSDAPAAATTAATGDDSGTAAATAAVAAAPSLSKSQKK